MPRKLKTYQTSLGFYDLAVAAPSMKAALAAWEAGSNLFHQGFAREVDDPDVVRATMAKPGVVLKRPAGSNGPFAEHAGLPTDLATDGGRERRPKARVRKTETGRRDAKISESDARQAALAFQREQKRQDAARRRAEAAREKARAKREKLVAKAEAALDKAKRQHEDRSEALAAERAAIDKRIEAEDARWESERERLAKALRHARD
jgi:hypothetical protein